MRNSGVVSNTKPLSGFIVAIVQTPNAVVTSKEDINARIEKLCDLIETAKTYAGVELVVFPEGSIQGLGEAVMNPKLQLKIDGPEVGKLKRVCKDKNVYGVFNPWIRCPKSESNPKNTVIIVNPSGEIILRYEKLFPMDSFDFCWPGELGMPVCDGPAGSKLAVCVCHDGQYPELAREAAYKGANVYIRLSGYFQPNEQSMEITDRANAWSNLMYTISATSAGADDPRAGVSAGRSRVCSYDGSVICEGSKTAYEINYAHIIPRLADEARISWNVENNIYQFGHRGSTVVPGGITDCGSLTWMKDAVEGKYCLPWEDQIIYK